jgi:TM2 domain-containing membrane protein YozV
MRTDGAYAAGPNVVGGKQYAVGKSPVVALLLSLFLPAIGQFYNGDAKKAFAMWGGYVVGMILSVVYIGGLVLLAVWVWSMIDAYNVASGKSPLW